MRSLHPWAKVDQAVRPLPPRSLNILVGLTLKLDSLCITVSVVHLDTLFRFWNILNCWTGKIYFGIYFFRNWPKCEDFVGNMFENSSK